MSAEMSILFSFSVTDETLAGEIAAKKRELEKLHGKAVRVTGTFTRFFDDRDRAYGFKYKVED